MNYEEIRQKLVKCEVVVKAVRDRYRQGTLSNQSSLDTLQKLEIVKNTLTNRLQELNIKQDKETPGLENLIIETRRIIEQEGTVQTDDPSEAEKLAKKGVNVKLHTEEQSQDQTIPKALSTEVGKVLVLSLREVGEEISLARKQNTKEDSFEIYIKYINDYEDIFTFKIVGSTVFLVRDGEDINIGEFELKPSGDVTVRRELLKDSFIEIFSKIQEKVKNKKQVSEEFNESGLMITGRTQIDNNDIGDMLDDLGLYGEWNTREGYWLLPEEQDMYDSLEIQIQQELDKRDIDARFEGLFESKKKVNETTELDKLARKHNITLKVLLGKLKKGVDIENQNEPNQDIAMENAYNMIKKDITYYDKE